MNEYELKYFECLSEKFKNKKQVLAEIINLKAIMNLPKGTELLNSQVLYPLLDLYQKYLQQCANGQS